MSGMKRRELITLLGSVAAWPLAQQAAMPVGLPPRPHGNQHKRWNDLLASAGPRK